MKYFAKIGKWKAYAMRLICSVVGAIMVFLSMGGCSAHHSTPFDRITASKELPEGWLLNDIAKGTAFPMDSGQVSVLAWKIIDNGGAFRVESCLVLKHVETPTDDHEQWLIASVSRNSGENRWHTVKTYIALQPDGENPPFIRHEQWFRERPSNQEIYAFMDKVDWKLGPEDDWKVLDGRVCTVMWEREVGEKPTRTFGK
jgi:hypothetical protein